MEFKEENETVFLEDASLKEEKRSVFLDGLQEIASSGSMEKTFVKKDAKVSGSGGVSESHSEAKMKSIKTQALEQVVKVKDKAESVLTENAESESGQDGGAKKEEATSENNSVVSIAVGTAVILTIVFAVFAAFIMAFCGLITEII